MVLRRPIQVSSVRGGLCAGSKKDAVLEWLEEAREACSKPAADDHECCVWMTQCTTSEETFRNSCIVSVPLSSAVRAVRQKFLGSLNSKTCGVKVTSHIPDEWSCQRYVEEFSANMMRRFRRLNGSIPSDAGGILHVNVECFSGCVEFVVTAFSAEGSNNSEIDGPNGLGDRGPLIRDSVPISELFECLPRELQSGTVFVHEPGVDPLMFQEGVEQDPGTVALQVREAPNVCLVFPPCAASGVETEVEIHLRTNGRGDTKGLRVIGTQEGKAFLDEQLDGEGSVIRL